MSIPISASGTAVTRAAQHVSEQPPEPPSLKQVWTRTWNGLVADATAAPATPPSPEVQAQIDAVSQQLSHASPSVIGNAMLQQAGALKDQVKQILHMADDPEENASGTLQHIGLTLGLLTTIEQGLSTLVSWIPFPAFPALHVLDVALGMPHAHPAHPPFIPLPNMGPIIPIPILSGAANVLVNGFPAARCGDMGLSIWCGGLFPLFEVFLGSSSVWLEGGRAARQFVDITKHCIFSTPRPQDPPAGPFLGIPITGSGDVLIGGIPLPSLSALAIGAALRGLFKGLGKAVRAIANHLQARLPAGSRLNQWLCKITGHPIDVATGRMFTTAVDFHLPGLLPLSFERSYDSMSCAQAGSLGHGWTHLFDMHLWEDTAQGMLIVQEEQGRPLGFDLLEDGEIDENELEARWLQRIAKDHYVLWGKRGDRHHFARTRIDGDSTSTRAERTLRLCRIEDRCGNSIDLDWRAGGHLAAIRDSAGRKFLVCTDVAGRITEIYGPHPLDATCPQRLVEYEYDDNGDLVTVVDPLGQRTCYAYENHLMVRETDRNGLSFYFQYQNIESVNRCVRTWGDGDIHRREISFDINGRNTKVINSLGHARIYDWNQLGQVICETDSAQNQTIYTYDKNGRQTELISAGGQRLCYEYDERGNIIQVIGPDGVPLSIEYDAADYPKKTVDAGGATWQWDYDEQQRLTRVIDPLGHVTAYVYAGPQLVGIIDALGRRSVLTRDTLGNLTALRTPDGAESTCSYDAMGRPLVMTDPSGNRQERTYDALGRLIAVAEPDGQQRVFGYDGEGNITLARDKNHEITCTYIGKGLLHTITEQGITIEYHYDTEGQLTRVRNPHGDELSLRLDANGRVIEEIGFDGNRRKFERDAGGQVIRQVTGNGKITQYQHDKAGRIHKIFYPDGDISLFEYRYDGVLTRAKNGNADITFQHDLLGQVIKEQSDGRWVAMSYDALGRMVSVHSSDGVRQQFERDFAGRVVGHTFGTEVRTWHVAMSRDRTGNELERRLPGTVLCAASRDDLGRLRERTLLSDQNQVMWQRILWDVDQRIIQISDSITGTTSYHYDSLGRLILAENTKREGCIRVADAFGNIFETVQRRDRAYGPAGQLLQSTHAQYTYNEDGHLQSRRTTDGQLWQYRWSGAGRLASVERADGICIKFAYDALGRRIQKSVGTVETRWTWLGHKPLHERYAQLVDGRISDDERKAITWIFDPDSFSPVARLSGPRCEFVISDDIGTPLILLDERGTTTWSRRLDLYGRSVHQYGERERCPFRFPGQYEDTETGLYYNRFRYYDPEIGQYISADPIRLLGGVHLYRYVDVPINWVDILGLITLYHYTTQEGMEGIVQSQKLNPSTGPIHARFGDGQYLTDIKPEQVAGRTLKDLTAAEKEAGKKSLGQLAKDLYNDARKTTGIQYYVEIEIDGLGANEVRKGTFLIENSKPLDLEGRIKNNGAVLKTSC